jgi:carboxypeptidase Taq
MKKPFRNKVILDILDKYKDLWALSYTSAVANWDLETYMPVGGASARGEALGRLSTIRQRLFLDKSFVSLIHSAEKQKSLTDEELAVVRVLVHSLKFYEKLPPKFLEDFSKITSEATVIWREAKLKNNFKMFEPSLSKIFDMNKQAAEYLGYKDSSYDALLDQFEEDLKSKDVEKFFGEIKEPLKELLTKIITSKKYFKTHPLETAKYDQDKMVVINRKVLRELWADPTRLRLDISTHPFTTSFSNQDTRITTWYHGKDFGRSILAVIHEFGHALYDLQCSNKLEMTPIQGASSLVIHESQSRFWENFVGRSDEFLKHYLIDFKGLSKEISRFIDTNKIDGLRMYFNKVSPSLLRVEADEVTYHFHIMLRYEIEKGLIEGKLKVKDLPEIWNVKMKEYLGIVPKKDSDGVLQDVHWSGGMVGYFPTYSLGTFLGAQFENQMESGNWKMENVEQTKGWLKSHVHRYGSTYTLQDLLAKNKMKYDPKVNLKYLEEKYSKIYGF